MKAETYEWDGSTVYATVTNTYTVLDQVTLTRPYAGSTSSSTYQDTTAEYDGYGRLYRQHVPEQFIVNPSSSIETLTYTTFTYNADDTRASVTDGRGASTTYSYNNRHLVTQIEYAVPGGSGITVPDDTVFTYDGAGNRTSMTDDSGNTDYVYDQQSRLIEETRYFDLTLPSAPESGNGFKLEYSYGLDGKLATLTDPYSHTFTYARDNLGRLTGVTGTSFAGITTYASNAEYRAWDAPKALDYGNSLSMSMTFNSRQQAATFEVSKTGSTVIQKAYEYYNDGKLKFTDDLLNPKFDRLNTYDSVGRLHEGFSGALARGESLDDYANQPYYEEFSYDAFDHTTVRYKRHWTEIYVFNDGFDRNRRTGWDYDGAGRVTRMGSTTEGNEVSYVIDAAGKIKQDTATTHSRSNMNYDGDGQMTVQTKFMWNTGTSAFNTNPASDTLFIRSSVLGGTVISEALGASGGSNAGKMLRTRVPADGAELAHLMKGSSDAVTWPMAEPVGSYRLTNSSGGVVSPFGYGEPTQSEADPEGADVQLENPYDIANPPLLEYPGSSGFLMPFPVSAAYTGNTYMQDGIPVPYEQLQRYIDGGLIGGNLGLVEHIARGNWLVANSLSLRPEAPDSYWRPRPWQLAQWNFFTFTRDDKPAKTGTSTTLPTKQFVGLVNAFFELYVKLKAGKFSEDCKKKVLDKLESTFGVTLDSLIALLDKGANFYNGTTSTAPVAGTLVPRQPADILYGKNATIDQAFAGLRYGKMVRGLQRTAMTSLDSPSLLIYFREGEAQGGFDGSNNGVNIQNISLLFHEILHRATGKVDPDLQSVFLSEDQVGKDSNNLTEHFKRYCFSSLK